jgi:hypothetical protein
MKIKILSRSSTVFFLAMWMFGFCLDARSAEIPYVPTLKNQNLSLVPKFIGKEAIANPVSTRAVPQNPWTVQDPWSTGHNDSYMSDTYQVSGPLGHSPKVFSTFLGTQSDPFGLVVIATFDQHGSEGHMIAAASRTNAAENVSYVQLVLLDSKTLETLDTLDLPKEAFGGADFRPAGVYFYMDSHNRIVVGTKDRTIWVVSHSKNSAGKWSFSHNEADTYDLAAAIPAGDAIMALQPDWSGLLWFTSKGGVVGTLNMETGKMKYTRALSDGGERIVNSHSVDETGGVFIASIKAMYRFDADSDGNPRVTWRELYDMGTHVKAGQTDVGTGTTPTVMGDKYVTISDNGQPQMRVLVYKRAKNISGQRLVCAQPVFKPGQASNENSLVATDKSIIIENNFGYKDPKTVTHGQTTTPGIARIDVDEQGRCRTVWTNETVSIPSLVTKMSLANGLIYTYTKPKSPVTTDPWYFTAIDFRTGKMVWQQLAGIGWLYNNHYSATYLGLDGTLYVGVVGGIVAMRDGAN